MATGSFAASCSPSSARNQRSQTAPPDGQGPLLVMIVLAVRALIRVRHPAICLWSRQQAAKCGTDLIASIRLSERC